MKRKLSLMGVLFAALALFCVSCSEPDAGKTATQGALSPLTDRYEYDLSEYIEVGNWKNIRVACADPTVCTEEEIDRAVEQVLLSYATFEKKDGAAESFNKVRIDYRMFREDGVTELEGYHVENYDIVIDSDGYGDLDKTMGKALLGAKPGDERSARYTFPEGDAEAGSWAGMTVVLKAEVKTVYQHYLPECNDEFVATLEGEGGTFSSVEEFRDTIRGDILYQKEMAKTSAVFNAYMDSVTVKKYPEREVADYMEKERTMLDQSAQMLSMSTDEYLSTYLGKDRVLWEAETELSVKTRVKNEMACIQLSRLMGTTLSEEEYREGLERMYLDEGGSEGSDFASIEEFEAAYTEKEIRESLLWEKSFGILVSEAITEEK